jgi:acetyl esterase/lipase
MMINKAMRAALKAVAYLNVDIKKSYKVERGFENLSARIRGKPAEYTIWDHRVQNGDYEVPVRVFLPKKGNPRRLLLFFHGGGWVTGSIES